MNSADRIELVYSMDEISASSWNSLLSTSSAPSVFSSWQWFKAWSETLGQGEKLLIPLYFRDKQLIGALPLKNNNGVIGFAAPERRDYCDVLINAELGTSETSFVLNALLQKASTACTGFKCFELNRVPDSSPLMAGFNGGSDFHATKGSCTPAPRMDMSAIADALRKKSLRRHANALGRLGTVECATYENPSEVAPLLDPFFEQHERRWQNSPTPSLFVDSINRDFYRALTSHLGEAGFLRFSTVRLNGALVAAHFGFLHSGIFTWYKPTFEPSLAKHSPGEVLIKFLLETARDEKANVFDFTIGDEAFKLRFATEIPHVNNLHLTDSRIAASLRRGRGKLARLVRS